ncbi:MAG: hypothetical protein SNJ64_03425 [Endomicrobiia bacterium]
MIKIIGVGGCGVNVLIKLSLCNKKNKRDKKVSEIEYIALNTDKLSLDKIQENTIRKVLIGETVVDGNGCDGKLDVAKQIVELKNTQKIFYDLIKNSEKIILTGGLGGGTGTVVLPEVAKCSKDADVETVVVVPMPFTKIESEERTKNAQQGVDKLRKYVDKLIVVENDRILEKFPKATFDDVFEKMEYCVITKEIMRLLKKLQTKKTDL